MRESHDLGRYILTGAGGLLIIFGAPLAVKWLASGVNFFDGETQLATDTAATASDAPTEPFNWTPIIWIAAVVGVLLAIGLVAWLAARRARSLRSRAGTHELRAVRWEAAVRVWQTITEALMEFETDPASIFDRPLLGDVTERATARFYEKFDHAANLLPEPGDRSGIDPGPFADAAAAALRAYRAADENARTRARRNIGPAGRVLSDDEVTTLRRARKLLNTALDEAATASEAMAAFEQMRDLVESVLEIPMPLARTVTTQIETVRRKALTA